MGRAPGDLYDQEGEDVGLLRALVLEAQGGAAGRGRTSNEV